MAMAEQIANQLRDLKTIPHVAIHACELLYRPGSKMADIERLILADPVLVARVLDWVNGALQGLGIRVSTVAQTVRFLGRNGLRNLVMMGARQEMLLDTEANGGLPRKPLWVHAAAVALAAKLAARVLNPAAADLAFLAGLLHDIGMIAFDQLQPERYAGVIADYRSGARSLSACERAALNTDREEVATTLTRRWTMPAGLAAVFERAHRPLQAQELGTVTGAFQLGHYIAERAGHVVFAGHKEPLRGAAAAYAESSPEAIDELSREFDAQFRTIEALYA